MPTRRQLFRYVLLALMAGVLLAGAFTHITYPCPPLSGDTGCVSFEKAVMHPMDLAANTQGSLVRFSLDILVGFAIALVVLVAFAKLRVKRSHQQ
jgi:hypothetical protein